jgi:hypothetical protein
MTAMSETQAAATDYSIMNGSNLLYGPDHQHVVRVSGAFTYDEATSTESNLDIFLDPQEENTSIVRGPYSQKSPFKTPNPQSIVASAAGVQPMCTVEVYWTIAGGILTFSGWTYTNTATGQKLEGSCSGGAART